MCEQNEGMHPRPLENPIPERLELTPGMTVATAGADRLTSAISLAIGYKGTVFNNLNEAVEHSCDVVLLAGELRPDWLDQARRILKPGGRLAILGGHSPIHEAVFLLEQNSWTLHHQEPAGPGGFLLIATPTDESVQS